MPKKFISFLGAGYYEPTKYYFNADPTDLSKPTSYVQEAIFEKDLTSWQPSDQVLIFTTNDANQNNYLHRITGEKDLIENQGLKHILQGLSRQGRIGEIKAVPISDGNTETEIWEVFQTVFEHIENGDELYFDITYGFRSLPMLGMVLLDYARTLYNIKIKKIYYGNYEAGRALRQPGEMVHAPVLDMTPFAQLQEWTAAARALLQGGNAEPIAALTETYSPEISRNLRLFAPAILTCRGLQLTKEIDVESFKNLVVNNLNSPVAAQLSPLLEKIQEKLKPFSSNNLQNGIAAVQWCIDNGLVQQGYTFLQETIISLVIEKSIGHIHVSENKYRINAGAALNVVKIDVLKVNKNDKILDSEYGTMYDYVKKQHELVPLYKRLTGSNGLRNDINHCGFKTNYATPDELKVELNNIYKNFLAINLT